jgi:hypothetical protein
MKTFLSKWRGLCLLAWWGTAAALAQPVSPPLPSTDYTRDWLRSTNAAEGRQKLELTNTFTTGTGITFTTNGASIEIAATGEAEAVVPTNAITGWIADTNSANLITTTQLVTWSTNGLVPANVLTNGQANVVISGNFSGYGTNLLLWRNTDPSLQRFLGYWGPGQWGTNATNFAVLTTRSADQYTGRVLYVGEETLLRGISLQVGNSNSLSDTSLGHVDPRITLSMGYTQEQDHEIQWRFEEYTLTDGLHQPLLSYEEENNGRVWLGNTNGLGRVTARGIFDSPTNIISGGSFYGSALGLTNYPATNLLKGATGSAGQILTATASGVVWGDAPAAGGGLTNNQSGVTLTGTFSGSSPTFTNLSVYGSYGGPNNFWPVAEFSGQSMTGFGSWQWTNILVAPAYAGSGHLLTNITASAITNAAWLVNNQSGVSLAGDFSVGSSISTLQMAGYDEASEALRYIDDFSINGTTRTLTLTSGAIAATNFIGSAQSLTNLPPSGITDTVLTWGGPTNSIPCTNATLFYESATDVLLSTVTGSATGRKQWASLVVSNSSAGNITLRVTNALWRAIGTTTTNALVIPGSKVGLLSVECWGTFQLYGTAVQQ